MSELALEEIQGIVISGYGKLPWASFALLRMESTAGGREFLRQILPHITTAANRSDQCRLNIAITATGLRTLDVSDDVLRTFLLPFQQGMAHDDRSRVLGDLRENQPANWNWGASSPVDLLVMLYAKQQATLEQRQEELIGQALAAGLVSEVVPAIGTEPPPNAPTGFGREHFGFADGISQPILAGSYPPNSDFAKQMQEQHGAYLPHNTIAPGEFILGYENEYGQLPDSPVSKKSKLPGNGTDLGRNGSYLVARQLSQDVGGFWQFVDEQTRGGSESDEQARVRLASKLVGRWPDGTPLSAASQAQPAPKNTRTGLNDLSFADSDPHGLGCPLGSHIRRANPRDTLDDDPQLSHKFSKRHRILRRGRNYGPFVADPFTATADELEQERGLFFMCLNTNISRQFEFVQHTWLNNAKFNGLYDETDPLLGPRYGDLEQKPFTVQQQPIRRRVHGLSQFVTVRGGAYFFLPGMHAIRWLANS